MSDETPTERINAGEMQEDLKDEKAKSKGLLIGLVAAGALLLVAIIVLGFFLLGRSAAPGVDALPTPTSTDVVVPSDSPSPGETPIETPAATAEPTAEPSAPTQTSQPQAPATGAAFTQFSPTKQVACDKGAPNFTPDPPAIKISWKTVRTDSAWIVQGTSDAADSQFMQIPLNGNQSNFQYTLQFPCFQANATYTITLVGSDGHHLSKSWKVTNTGDKD
ncbi:MAG: hypothetical protein ABI632_01005 [Pseudolysinimonas sp.]